MTQAQIAAELRRERRRVEAGLQAGQRDYRRLAPLDQLIERMARILLMGRSVPERRRDQAFALERAELIARGTQKRLRDALARAGADETVAELAERLGRSAFSTKRAGVIARTERRYARANFVIQRLTDAGADRVLLADGPGCHLFTHTDGPIANGLVISLEQYEQHPLAHPNCRRRVIRALLPSGRGQPV